jgi:hypothetical protein
MPFGRAAAGVPRAVDPAKGKTRIRACCSSGATSAILEPSRAKSQLSHGSARGFASMRRGSGPLPFAPFQGVQSVESELASVPLAQNAPRCRQTGTVELSAGVHRRDKLRRTTRNRRTHQLRRLRRGVATRKSEIHDPSTVRTDAGSEFVFPTGDYSFGSALKK